MRAPRKILLVDDSVTALLHAELLLRGPLYQVVVARNGREAVRAAVDEHPDVIVMDVVMPEMDGLSACRAIRGRDDTCTIPVIFATSRGEMEAVEAAYSAGGSDYVTKPIDAVELLRKIRSSLGELP